MPNHIVSADVNVHEGLLRGRIQFQPGLNLLSGENGTLKTKLLQALKAGGQRQLFDPSAACRVQAVSPKRNAQRRAFKAAYDQLRRSATKLDSLINERNINDAGFEDYPALGDLFYVVYEDLCRDGGDQIKKMEETAKQFNHVIGQIFDHYELIARWNQADGSPNIELKKHGGVRVPLDGLSLGELEVLSLAINIYASRGRYDVYLIDEPEVHLNWHLEERLFDYLDNYCQSHGKQMVVVTHSRVVFKERFLRKATFMYWSDGRVEWGRTVTPEQRRRIAGDAIEIIRVGDFSKPTFFVEDHAHAVVVEALRQVLGAEAIITRCGDRSSVRSLFKHSRRDGTWSNSHFLEDGDGEGTPFPGDASFIHLEKYCIENYLLDAETAAAASRRSALEIQGFIYQAVLARQAEILKKNKWLDFLIAGLKAEDLTPERLAQLDASKILDVFLQSVGMSLESYVAAYALAAHDAGRLSEVLPASIVAVLEAAVPEARVAPAPETDDTTS